MSNVQLNKTEEEQYVAQAIRGIMKAVEQHPQLTICQHLNSILRRKSNTGPESYHWTAKTLVSRIEKHLDNLESGELTDYEQ